MLLCFEVRICKLQILGKTRNPCAVCLPLSSILFIDVSTGERWRACIQLWFLIDVRRANCYVSLFRCYVRRVVANCYNRSGRVWDTVYAALEPYGVSVVDGRVSGVGVAGFTLGGSKTNHFFFRFSVLKIPSIYGSPISPVWQLTLCSPLN